MVNGSSDEEKEDDTYCLARLEWPSPLYMEKPCPMYTGLPKTFDYNARISLNVDLPIGVENVSVVIMDFGFTTHGVHMDQCLAGLVSELSDDKTKLTVTGPPSVTIYSPGPAFVFVLADGVPSFGLKTLIGTGAQPPLDEDALANTRRFEEDTAVLDPRAADTVCGNWNGCGTAQAEHQPTTSPPWVQP
ncbi:hypothetical protein D9758_005208 [Tetrapyrgos nigripes]|uniref:Galactose oxidase-like Early set domain-containing protein n=1 Tax=Tetrapyrgos nigripes TaxID=182062 RepID=A0A8H5LX22_9AGAR|nr:hypothetical protein D9758_005208 [Tetrapyrgos nigripes]